jgi:TRAP-type C4-dicarboxylate transport system substrate-binding protein
MPMGEVYSALAKGVLDGVIAPADTLKSLHFAEVAKFYSRLQVPRGAYPARAMGERRWNSLSPHDQAILEAGKLVWEAAIAHETEAAVAAGEDQGHREGVKFIDVAAAEQRRFDDLYELDAERNAKSLSRYDIDGESVFRHARALADELERTGTVTCGAKPD